MTQRTIAALVAGPLLVVLLVAASCAPLPYATYKPGPTVDVLGEDSDGGERIQISGQRTYPDDGELRLTTVFVSGIDAEIGMGDALKAWVSGDRAVYPYDAVHPDGETREESEREGAVQMITSQDEAVAAALRELDYDLETTPQVSYVDPELPAQGRLEVRDTFVEVDGEKVSSVKDVLRALRGAEPGTEIEIEVRRHGQERTVRVAPAEVDGRPQIGILLGTGYEFPFEVEINISDEIGGPSAGLMFALSVYDTLTPDSLSGGRVIAGTGTISAEGEIGPIGGIQQKIAGARDDGAELFLVPSRNCDDAEGAENGDMRLVQVAELADATEVLRAFAEDPEADLPSCQDQDQEQEASR